MLGNKKKPDLSAILDDLRCQDPKKRLAAVLEIKQVAAAMGAARVRSELIVFLAQFVDDEQQIILQLINQLQGFTQLLGGQQHQKCLIPLLVSFCKMDQRRIGIQSCRLLLRILLNFKDLGLQTIKKLVKTDMNVSRECGIILMTGLLPLLQHQETSIIELFLSLYNLDNAQMKIKCCKYLHEILKGAKNKQQLGKIIQNIYNEGQQLTKMYAIPALIDYYQVSNNLCLTKFKNLSVLNSWRINMKLCDYIEVIAKKVTKPHFKLIFQPSLLKFLTSNEPQLRASSCQTLSSLCRNMTDEQLKSKLLPIIKKLLTDSVDYVKVQLSKYIVPLCNIVNTQILNQFILPIIYTFVKDPIIQITLGIIKSFQYLASKISKDLLEQKIIKPILSQLSTQNWRVKCQILQILKLFFINQSYLTQTVLKVFFSLTDDKIDAVRLKANQIIIQILAKCSKQWSDQYIIPKISGMKDATSYVKRQNILEIIQKTSSFVSEKALKQHYLNVVSNYLNDKTLNVRLKGIMVVKNNNKLINSTIQKQLDKLKQDKQVQIREAVKKLRA